MEGSWCPDIFSREVLPVKDLPSLQPCRSSGKSSVAAVGGLCQPRHGSEPCKLRLGVPRVVQIPQPLVGAAVIAVLSLTHRTTSENLYIKIGETKSHWQKETTKAFRRHSLICSLHSNNPKWLLIYSNNGVLTDLKGEKINHNRALEGWSGYSGNCSAVMSGRGQ